MFGGPELIQVEEEDFRSLPPEIRIQLLKAKLERRKTQRELLKNKDVGFDDVILSKSQ